MDQLPDFHLFQLSEVNYFAMQNFPFQEFSSSDDLFTLQQLLGSISVHKFFTDFHESQVLHTQGYWDNIGLSSAILIELLRDSNVCSSSYSVINGNRTALVPTIDVQSQLADKNSIVVCNVDNFLSDIKLLCQKVGLIFGALCNANAYFSPAHSQGLLPHFDNHDVIILQLEGCKNWCVQKGKAPLVTKGSLQATFDNPTEPMYQIIMNVGDVMYIPRGQIHWAETHLESSLHITLALYPYEWSEVLALMIDLGTYRNREFRKSVSLGIRKKCFSDIQDDLHFLLAECINESAYCRALQILEQRALAND